MLATVLALLLLQTPNPTTARPTPARPAVARPPRKPAAAGHLVYLCGGSRSFAYHAAPDCEGLAWCTTSVRKATVAAAKKESRYPCGHCRPAR
jgi:hypothetical protein